MRFAPLLSSTSLVRFGLSKKFVVFAFVVLHEGATLQSDNAETLSTTILEDLVFLGIDRFRIKTHQNYGFNRSGGYTSHKYIFNIFIDKYIICMKKNYIDIHWVRFSLRAL